MNIDRLISGVKNRLPLTIRFLLEMLSYWRRISKYNASVSTDNDILKMQYTLQRETHVIEKGMSIRNTRRGFGQAKICALLQRLEKYYDSYGNQDKDFLLYPLCAVKEYIQYQRRDGVEIPEIESAFANLCAKANLKAETLSIQAGYTTEPSTELELKARGDFRSLLESRHSIRYFTEELPSHKLLDEALQLASRTPSACNRQAWHTHIYFGDESKDLLRMQTGCNGFYEDINCSIVVTADMKGFLGHEPFQCYIDGGLYAQNLINALHFVGLGAIPLSCGFMSDMLLNMQKRFDIPENEVMIVIIGTGIMPDEVKVAVSTRKPIEVTNRYHC